MTVGWKRWRNVPRKRSRSQPDNTPVTVGEVGSFIAQTLTPTPGVAPLWLRLRRAMSLRLNQAPLHRRSAGMNGNRFILERAVD